MRAYIIPASDEQCDGPPPRPLFAFSSLLSHKMSSRSLAALAVGAVALFTRSASAAGVTSDSSGIAGHTYDYIVVGGGLAGTTVAARLAENSAISVLLIEAGGDDRGNSQVYDIYEYAQAFNGPLDWAWQSDRGKVLHGCVMLGILRDALDEPGRLKRDHALVARRSVVAARSTAATGRAV